MIKKYRTHKYETWLPERPKKDDKKDIRDTHKNNQQKRNDKFEF